MIYFTADLHLGDDRIEEVLLRPFKNLEEMHTTIVSNWNDTVKENDTIYLLGDVVKNNPEKYLSLIQQLNGKIYLIKGNHDKLSDKEYRKYFEEVYKDLILHVKKNNQKSDLYLVHEPEKGKKELFNLVGHIHSLFKVQRNMINVGLDVWNFRPVSLVQILKTIEAIDKYYDINVFAGELECNLEKK